jgi:hypothetical protein
LVFCDDDNWFQPDFVKNAYSIMASDPLIGAAGGEGRAVTDGKLPDWFEDHKSYYACYRQRSEDGELSGSTAFLYGAGLVVRKRLFLELHAGGLETVLTDRTGTKLSSGGDNEFCYLIRLRGYKLWYSSRLQFFHYLPQARLTEKYLYRLITAIAYSSMKLIIYHYVLTGKKVTRITWIYDFSYRALLLINAVFKAPFVKGSFQRKTLVSGSWQAFLAVLDQFGTYRKSYRRLLALKK